MPDPFGSFSWICRSPIAPLRSANAWMRKSAADLSGSHVNLPQCNLFFSQLFNHSPPHLTQLFPTSSAFYKLYDVVSGSPDSASASR